MKHYKALLFLLAIPLFFSCNNATEEEAEETGTDSIPTAAVAPPAPQNNDKPSINTTFSGKTFPAFFEAAFEEGTVASQGVKAFTFSRQEVGKIRIESGKIIACDPAVIEGTLPFTQTFPTGEFPVQLAIATYNKDKKVALSRIKFSEEAVAEWKFALQLGEEPISIKDPNIYCFGVDGKIAVFIDERARKAHMEEQEQGAIFEKAYDHKGDLFHFKDHSLAIFPCGTGSGCYATYIGYDKTGKPCRLLVDFAMVNWWLVEE